MASPASVRSDSPRIPEHEKALLEWFFSYGQTAFERSTMGPMLDRAETYSLEAAMTAMQVRGEDISPLHPTKPVTARPTAEVKNVSGYVPDNKTLEKYATVSRRLAMVEREWPVAAAALEYYFGDVGFRSGDTDHGRMLSLYTLTASGKKLIELSKRQTEKDSVTLHLSDHERMAVQADLERIPGQSKLKRKMLLRAADREAIELLREAGRIWNRTGRLLV